VSFLDSPSRASLTSRSIVERLTLIRVRPFAFFGSSWPAGAMPRMRFKVESTDSFPREFFWTKRRTLCDTWMVVSPLGI